MSIPQEDNKENQVQCSKFAVKFSPKLGRYLEAEKDLEGQEVIIDEIPLVVAPSGHHDWHLETQRPLSICIGCLKSQNQDVKFQKCSNCSWPVCAIDCVGISKFHSSEECNIFKARGIIQSPRSLKMVYILRCCLMQRRNPENWTNLLELASTPEVKAMDGPEGSEAAPEKNREYEFLTEVCGLEDVDEQDVRRINGVKRVNGFSFYNSDSDEVRFYGMALYYKTSMASHGCSPNLTTQVVYDPTEGFPMRLRTKTDVKKGETLQIAYRDRWLVLGTLRRREKIFQDHKFLCQCSRCADPTEDQTFFSALVCSKCREENAETPFLLPKDPLDFDSDWKCMSCEGCKNESEVAAIIEEVTSDTEKILESGASNEEKFEQLLEYLNGTSPTLLHPNNYLVLRLELEWIRLFPMENFENLENLDDCKSWELFLKLLERAEHCKKIYCQLIPDWADKNNFVDVAIGRAYYLYYLQQERLALLENDLVLDLVKICLGHIQKAARNESPCSETAKLCFTMCTSIGNVKRLIRAQSCDKTSRVADADGNACD